MCLILFAYRHHPRYRLIVAANRDEFLDRPSAPAAFWPEYPYLLGGKDLKSGGTWLGMTRTGRMAAVTNYRDPRSVMDGAPSRGHLVTHFLAGDESAHDYMTAVAKEAHRYNGFNLLADDHTDLYHFSNRNGVVTAVKPGIHGISNNLLNTPWPKLTRGKQLFHTTLAQDGENLQDALFRVLADNYRPNDADLPDTGVGLEWERVLSTIFINHRPVYATRSSTVVMIDYEGIVTFRERTFNTSPETCEEADYNFVIDETVNGTHQ